MDHHLVGIWVCYLLIDLCDFGFIGFLGGVSSGGVGAVMPAG